MAVESGCGNLIRRIAIWGDDRNILKGGTPKDQFVKLISEIGELADHIAKNNKEKIKDDIGDCMVVLTMIAYQNGLSMNECLEQAYNDIKDRKGILYQGVFVKESDPLYAEVCEKVRKGE